MTQATPPSCCIVFTTDLGYLFPTLVSAMQARRHVSQTKADVLICHFGVEDAAERLFADICAREGIGLLAVDPATIEHATPMMSRLFLDRFLPVQYQQILYLDGDVQISRSLDPLIEAEVAPGQFLAVNDPMTFLLADRDAQSLDLARHMAAMGLTPLQAGRYFNTGVLRINRTGWEAIGQRAWALTQNGPPSRFPDQDPLNRVATDCHLPLSLAWNFPIFMRNARVEAAIDPCITHFMSNPKPWQGSYLPWDAQACAPYDDAITTYPALGLYRQALPLRRRIHYRLLQTAKKLLESRKWGYSARRARILEYENRVMLSARQLNVAGREVG
jgi:lipopolysaccharide biosynthesis glycosyltransferase